MVRDGVHYGLILGLLALICGLLLSPWAAIPWITAALFCFYFFRDPERPIPHGRICVSPADGKIVQLRQEPDQRTRVSIFLSIFDVHVNRVPVSGRIQSIRYCRGSFGLANLEAASTRNEQNALVITTRDGGDAVELRQIAGLIARRIVCHKKVGDDVEMGERFGLIKFGSRVDLLLGANWEILVGRGDKVVGGSSVLARRKTGGLDENPP